MDRPLAVDIIAVKSIQIWQFQVEIKQYWLFKVLQWRMLIKRLIITNLTRLHSAFEPLSPVHKKWTYVYKMHILTWPIAWLWLDLDLCMWDIWLYAARLFTPFSAHLLLAVSASSALFIFWGVFFFLFYAAIFTKQRPLHLYTAASPRGCSR